VRIEENAIPVIASDIIYEGAAVGVVDATGHARPLNAADRFAGFANAKADNSLGAAAAINVDVKQQGFIQLPVTGAVITDLGQPVYATDDDAFGFTPVCRGLHRLLSSRAVIGMYYARLEANPGMAWIDGVSNCSAPTRRRKPTVSSASRRRCANGSAAARPRVSPARA
jgi:hypothetical protein